MLQASRVQREKHKPCRARCRAADFARVRRKSARQPLFREFPPDRPIQAKGATELPSPPPRATESSSSRSSKLPVASAWDDLLVRTAPTKHSDACESKTPRQQKISPLPRLTTAFDAP